MTRVPGAQHFFRSRPWGSYFFVVVVCVIIALANFFYIAQLRTQDALSWTSQISTFTMHAQPAIDPNVGYLTQALGHLAAHDLLHLHMPWWNPYAGVGMPLAGDMQSGALSPVVALLALPNGLLWFHLALEIAAGIATYLLLRRWVESDIIAMTAGVLFGLNGTFAWVGNAVENPVLYLPLALLGIEIIVSAMSRRRWGFTLLAVAIAGSIYAGFPEVAFLNALMVVAFGVLRSFSLARVQQRRAIGQVVIGVVMGVALSLPILVAFGDYLAVADVGIHRDASHVALPLRSLAMMVNPYIMGPINNVPGTVAYWGGIGGFFGVGLLAVSTMGIWGRRWRAIRVFLVSWLVFSLLGSFNVGGSLHLWNVIPFVHQIVLGRYITSSCELAVIILAAFALDDVRRREMKWSTAVASLLTGSVLVTVINRAADDVTRGTMMSGTARMVIAVSHVAPFVILGLMLLAVVVARGRWRYLLVATTLILEVVGNFAVTEVAAPRDYHLATGPLSFLQHHLTGYRVVSFNPIQPNWGSFFELATLNAHDLPFPTKFEELIAHDLPLGSPHAPWSYYVYEGRTGAEAYSKSVATHLSTFENAGVKFIIANTDWPLDPAFISLHLPRTYHGEGYDIYELPHPSPLYSAPGCRFSSESVNAVTATCDHPQVVIRRELSMPGWTATINGHAVNLDLSRPYQRIVVMSGVNTLRFNFSPPHEMPAEFASAAAMGGLLMTARRNRRRSDSREDATSPSG